MRDLILSSGFLAFARHTGVLDAVVERGVEIGAVVGSSSGALAGAFFAAGYSPDAIAEELSSRRPFGYFRPSPTPWRGAFSLRHVVEHLRRRLPATFEGLERPLALGVAARERGGLRHALITSGSLPEAIAASCAIPWVFSPVTIDGVRWIDGGIADRLGLAEWRRWRPGRRAWVHAVESARGEAPPAESDEFAVIETPRSGASFFSLGDFAAQRREAHARARARFDAECVEPSP